MSLDRLIWIDTAYILERTATDVTGLPAEASLIAESDWGTLVTQAGNEGILLTELGVRYAEAA